MKMEKSQRIWLNTMDWRKLFSVSVKKKYFRLYANTDDRREIIMFAWAMYVILLKKINKLLFWEQILNDSYEL